VDSEPKADMLLGGVAAIESLYATDELSVPMSIVVDERGIVEEIIPGWSAETQKRFRALAGEGTAGESRSAPTPKTNSRNPRR
jgi:hypothetical protein